MAAPPSPDPCRTRCLRAALLAAAALCLLPMPAALGAQMGAQATMAAPGAPAPSYADLVDLAERAELIVRARVRKQAEVPADRAPGLAAGHVRLFVEAETQALIAGRVPVGERLRYLVDLPRDERGRAPRLRRQVVLLFASAVPNRPGELRLVDAQAQLPATPALEERLRPIIASTLAPGKPPVVTGIADVLSIPGNLAGESETQLFLRTASGAPASISVVRRPDQAPRWGVSWTELVDAGATPPAPETLGWHRLACGLPAELPADADLASDPAARAQAQADYALVRAELGPCTRTRTRPSAQPAS